MCGMGTDYTSCTKLQRTDKTLIYQHIFIYQLISPVFFFPQWKKKKSSVLVLKHCTGKKFPVITPQNNCKYKSCTYFVRKVKPQIVSFGFWLH